MVEQRSRRTPRRRRGAPGPVVAVALACVVAVLAGSCADHTLRPASLTERPPKDPPPRAAPADQTTPAPDEGSSDDSRSDDALEVPCATITLEGIRTWERKEHSDGWVFTVPGEIGGGVVEVTGTYFTGDDARTNQPELETQVRGKEGPKAEVEVSGAGVVVGRVPVKSGKEWRLAKAFGAEKASEFVSIRYAPAGGASDAEIKEGIAILQSAASGAELTDPGGCENP